MPTPCKVVLHLAAADWNWAVAGEAPDADTVKMGRRIFSSLGWPGDFEGEARRLGQRKAILFPDERRLFLGVEVTLEAGELRVYALSAVA